MAVHVPLSLEAQLEARKDDCRPTTPASRERQPIIKPSQDTVC
jgi:hypothetical protein